MAFYNPDLVERGNYVKLNKVFSTTECVKCFVD